jgi:CBS domain-containing protein
LSGQIRARFIRPTEEAMRIDQVMTQAVVCTRPDATLQEAAGKMRELDVGTLPVCGDEDRLIGMITDRDITVRGVAGGNDPRLMKVRDIMTPSVVYCYSDDDVERAARVMEQKKIRRLVVLDHDKKLVGIVSLGDLAVCTGDEPMVGEALEAISQPGAARV